MTALRRPLDTEDCSHFYQCKIIVPVLGDTHRQQRTLILAESKHLYNTLKLNLSHPRQRLTTVGDDGSKQCFQSLHLRAPTQLSTSS